jgi:glucose-1-phosphate adenylyltransferase
MVIESIISNGCIISGANIFRCVLSPDVRVNSYAEVSNSIVFNRVNIGRHCRIRRAIIDKDVQIPPYTIIGFDQEEDQKRFTVTESGITVVSAGDLETTKLGQEHKLISG